MRIKIKPCIKIKYDSEEEALEEAKRKNKNAKSNAKLRKRCGLKQVRQRKMSAYMCRWCGKYHLTSQKQRKACYNSTSYFLP